MREIPEAARQLVKDSEGLRLKAYLDGGGVRTIGWGHTRNVQHGDIVTVEQAEDLLENDLRIAGAAVERLVDVELTDAQFGALVSFVFNIGANRLASSTLLRLLNEGDLVGAANEFPRWVFDNGVKQPGLVIRRAREREMFVEGSGLVALAESPSSEPPITSSGSVVANVFQDLFGRFFGGRV